MGSRHPLREACPHCSSRLSPGTQIWHLLQGQPARCLGVELLDSPCHRVDIKDSCPINGRPSGLLPMEAGEAPRPRRTAGILGSHRGEESTIIDSVPTEKDVDLAILRWVDFFYFSPCTSKILQMPPKLNFQTLLVTPEHMARPGVTKCHVVTRTPGGRARPTLTGGYVKENKSDDTPKVVLYLIQSFTIILCYYLYTLTRNSDRLRSNHYFS